MDEEQRSIDYEYKQLCTKIENIIVGMYAKLEHKETIPTQQGKEFARLAEKLFYFDTRRVKNYMLRDWLNKNKDWIKEYEV